MGDRFYLAQIAATGSCPGYKGSASKRKEGAAPRLTKAAVLADMGLKTEGLSKLTLESLLGLSKLDFSNKFDITMPTGRLKAPYLNALAEVLGNIDLSKLTVADLKDFINEIAK